MVERMVVRMIVDGKVIAEDVISDDMSFDALKALSQTHEEQALPHLAEGRLVELRTYDSDGSLFAVTILAPDDKAIVILHHEPPF
jgi:hypothetical protein